MPLHGHTLASTLLLEEKVLPVTSPGLMEILILYQVDFLLLNLAPVCD